MTQTASPTQSFNQGVEAHAAGLKRADNPYGLRSPEHAEWEAGWSATLDLDEESDPASNRDQPADNPRDPSGGA